MKRIRFYIWFISNVNITEMSSTEKRHFHIVNQSKPNEVKYQIQIYVSIDMTNTSIVDLYIPFDSYAYI